VSGPVVAREPASTEGLFAWEDGALSRARVTQCALSRICGACGRPLGRPVVFLGTVDEHADNTFHAPPMHVECAERVRGLLGTGWEAARTSGFEFVRPVTGDVDPRPRFQPNSLLG
jgi:hypothetical protein